MNHGKKIAFAGVALIFVGLFGANTLGGIGLLLLVIGAVVSFVDGRRSAD
jgi:hypothetical protein